LVPVELVLEFDTSHHDAPGSKCDRRMASISALMPRR
jgi:hypothetical protein